MSAFAVAIGAKAYTTYLIAPPMAAFDPKRTLEAFAAAGLSRYDAMPSWSKASPHVLRHITPNDWRKNNLARRRPSHAFCRRRRSIRSPRFVGTFGAGSTGDGATCNRSN